MYLPGVGGWSEDDPTVTLDVDLAPDAGSEAHDAEDDERHADQPGTRPGLEGGHQPGSGDEREAATDDGPDKRNTSL